MKKSNFNVQHKKITSIYLKSKIKMYVLVASKTTAVLA